MRPEVDFTTAPPAPLTVAAAQAPCVAMDVAANVATAAALIREAGARGAQVVVFPELFLTGYELDAIAGDPALALTDGDPHLDPLCQASAESGAAALVGAPVRADGRLFISALVVAGGELRGRYDKQHLDAVERAAGFSPGIGGCTFELAGWRLGLGICWDSSFPEHARAAALDGCHAYLVGAMFAAGRGDVKRATLGPARALDNAFFVAFANHSGRSGPYEGSAGSAIWGPDATLLASAGTARSALAVARLDPAALAGARASDLTLTDPSLASDAGPRVLVTAPPAPAPR